MHLRVATESDAKEIVGVINAAFKKAESFFIDGNRIDLEGVEAFLGKGEFLLAEDNGLACCVYVELRGDRAYLGLLAVDPQRQNDGLGSLLMKAAEEHCAKAGCAFMDIRIVNLRKELPGFYRNRGYVETGTEAFPPGHNPKLPCHFVKMSKPLRRTQGL